MIRNLLLGLSGVAIGVSAYLSVERMRTAWRCDRWQAFYSLASAGFAGAIFLVAKAVLRSPRIPLSGDVVWYALSLTAASIGYIGIAVDQRRRGRRADDNERGS